MNAVSSHGTVISRAPAATPTVFTEIGGLGDLQPPSLSRNSFDVTTQNDDIDQYGVGVLRRAEVTFPINFRWDEPTHNHIAGLYKAIIDATLDAYKLTFPDGTEFVFNAFVTNITHQQPVDGVQRADVTLRPSGLMTLEELTIGETAV
jgi:hypothetical protein